MKPLSLFLFLLISYNCVFGQYEVKSIQTETPAKEKPIVFVYDSLLNIEVKYKAQLEDLDYFKQFIGQTILFYPRVRNVEPEYRAYANFFTLPSIVRRDTVWDQKKNKKTKQIDFKINTITSDKYKAKFYDSTKVAFCGLHIIDRLRYSYKYDTYYSGYFTPAEEIEGKTFLIKDIEIIKTSTSKYLKFYLRSSDNVNLYWEAYCDQLVKNEESYPFVLTGMIEKYKSLYSGESFLYTGINARTKSLNHGDIFAKTLKGEKIKIPKMSKLKFVDVNLIEEDKGYCVLSFIFEMDNLTQIYIPVCRFPELFNVTNAFRGVISSYNEKWAYLDEVLLISQEVIKKEKELAEQKIKEEQLLKQQLLEKRKSELYKKFGKSNADLILEGKVRIGMTKAMCIESWGEPSDINKSIGTWGVHEQWVYSYSYLYFEDGILTSIQN